MPPFEWDLGSPVRPHHAPRQNVNRVLRCHLSPDRHFIDRVGLDRQTDSRPGVGRARIRRFGLLEDLVADAHVEIATHPERGHNAGRLSALARGQGDPHPVRLVLDALGRTRPEQLKILRLTRSSLERLVILPRMLLGRLLRGQQRDPADDQNDACQTRGSRIHDALRVRVATEYLTARCPGTSSSPARPLGELRTPRTDVAGRVRCWAGIGAIAHALHVHQPPPQHSPPAGRRLAEYPGQLAQQHKPGQAPRRHVIEPEAPEVVGFRGGEPNPAATRRVGTGQRLRDQPATNPSALLARVNRDSSQLGQISAIVVKAGAADDLVSEDRDQEVSDRACQVARGALEEGWVGEIGTDHRGDSSHVGPARFPNRGRHRSGCSQDIVHTAPGSPNAHLPGRDHYQPKRSPVSSGKQTTWPGRVGACRQVVKGSRDCSRSQRGSFREHGASQPRCGIRTARHHGGHEHATLQPASTDSTAASICTPGRMFTHVLDHKGKTVFERDLPADPDAFLDAVKPFREGPGRRLRVHVRLVLARRPVRGPAHPLRPRPRPVHEDDPRRQGQDRQDRRRQARRPAPRRPVPVAYVYPQGQAADPRPAAPPHASSSASGPSSSPTSSTPTASSTCRRLPKKLTYAANRTRRARSTASPTRARG